MEYKHTTKCPLKNASTIYFARKKQEDDTAQLEKSEKTLP